jgi:hypothetical protein
MLVRTDDGSLWWGPGHLATFSTPDDPGLWAFMAGAYIRSAVALYRNIEALENALLRDVGEVSEERDPVTADAHDLVYTFLNTARHGVELCLKVLILCRRRLDRSVKTPEARHNLKALLIAALPIFEDYPDGSGRVQKLEQLVDIFSRIDPGGVENRYPAKRDFDDFTLGVVGGFVGFLATAQINLSDLARLLMDVEPLIYTVDLTETG